MARRDKATLVLIKQGVCLFKRLLHPREKKKIPVYNKQADLRTASGGFGEYGERGRRELTLTHIVTPQETHAFPFIAPCYRCDDREEARGKRGRRGGGRWEEEGGIDEGSQKSDKRGPRQSHLFLIPRGNISQAVLSWLQQRWSLSQRNPLGGICVHLGAGRDEKRSRGDCWFRPDTLLSQH